MYPWNYRLLIEIIAGVQRFRVLKTMSAPDHYRNVARLLRQKAVRRDVPSEQTAKLLKLIEYLEALAVDPISEFPL
jgi:hypothetical protein